MARWSIYVKEVANDLPGKWVTNTEPHNGNIIAAAPDMEKALKMYIDAMDSEPPSVEQFMWAEETARAALAKARGE